MQPTEMGWNTMRQKSRRWHKRAADCRPKAARDMWNRNPQFQPRLWRALSLQPSLGWECERCLLPSHQRRIWQARTPRLNMCSLRATWSDRRTGERRDRFVPVGKVMQTTRCEVMTCLASQLLRSVKIDALVPIIVLAGLGKWMDFVESERAALVPVLTLAAAMTAVGHLVNASDRCQRDSSIKGRPNRQEWRRRQI